MNSHTLSESLNSRDSIHAKLFQDKTTSTRYNQQANKQTRRSFAGLHSSMHFAVWIGCFSTKSLLFLAILYKVSVNKETKNNGKFLYSGVGCFEYFWSDAWIFPQKNKYEVSNSYMDHMRLHDVGPLCFPANRGSYTSSAGLLLHSKL